MNKGKSRILSVLLIFIMVLSTVACSSKEKETKKDGYIEGKIEMPVKLNELHTIKKIDDGSIIFVGANSEDGASGFATRSDFKVYESKDNGQSWVERKVELPNIDGTQVFFYGLAILNDGKILVTCSRFVSGEQNSEYRDFIIDKEGKYSEVKLREKPIEYLCNFISLNNGDIIYNNGQKIIQIDGKTLEEKKVYYTKKVISSLAVAGEYIIVKADTALSRIKINSDIEEDLDKLNLDIKSRIKDKDLFPYLLIPTESKNKIYCYNVSGFEEGLVSYNFDTNKFESIIPKNSSLSKNIVFLNGLIELKADEFIIGAVISGDVTSTAILKYTYEKNINLKPKKELTIYSLKENINIRRAVSDFNLKNNEITLKYQVGITEGSAVTESDAIKTLNTELMAGKGPDLLLLDDLPIKSYEKQGVLTDISSSVKKYEKELFTGVVDAYRVKDRIYALPMNINIPLVVAEKPLVNRINDIDSLEEVFKELDIKGDKLIMEAPFRTPEAFISSIYYMFENNWLKDKNKLDTENLLSFIEKSKSVYTISNNEIKEKEKKLTEEAKEDKKNNGLSEAEVKLNEIEGINVIQPITPIVTKDDYLQYGLICNYSAYEDILLQKIYNKEIGYKVFQKDNDNIFIPNETLGINNNSKNKKEAFKIFEELVLKNKGINNSKNPISINKKAFVETLGISEEKAKETEFDKDNNRYIKENVNYIDSTGWYTYYPNEEDIKSFTDEIDKLNVVAELNMELLKEVCNQFTKVINEGLSTEEAVEAVEENIQLYLQE